ncbi:AAA family ATPase [Pseudarcicella hirudinis]|uniref:AAA family ATPase n=1 Tax=Pseudarcicella hirudinis TaxID=1079859 RepID=UPI0035EBE6CD
MEFFINPLVIDDKVRLFGGKEAISKRDSDNTESRIEIIHELFSYKNSIAFYPLTFNEFRRALKKSLREANEPEAVEIHSFLYSFKRLFIKNTEKQKMNFSDDYNLSFSGNNLEKVLKRILLDKFKNEEISEWLDLFIPGFERVEVVSGNLSNTDTLLIYEKGIERPFTKDLISDGTYNILALLTAVYQSDESQFLCIEEPENGLNPKVIKELVGLFRYACKEKGHYIWLNTHSQSLVSVLEPKEIILVNKKNGSTELKQLKKDLNLYGLPMDEAWLSNALGGGLPW